MTVPNLYRFTIAYVPFKTKKLRVPVSIDRYEKLSGTFILQFLFESLLKMKSFRDLQLPDSDPARQ